MFHLHITFLTNPIKPYKNYSHKFKSNLKLNISYNSWYGKFCMDTTCRMSNI